MRRQFLSKLELLGPGSHPAYLPVKTAPLFFRLHLQHTVFSVSAESLLPLYTPLFATARITGLERTLEELINCGKIIRPAYMSISENKEYVDLKDR